MLKYGNKSRLRKDARSPASSQPPLPRVHGWKEASNDGFYGNHIFINAHPHETCLPPTTVTRSQKKQASCLERCWPTAPVPQLSRKAK